MNRPHAVVGAIAAVLLLAQPQTAFAYIDPGTGSLLVQGLIAGIAAASVAIRAYWARIRAFFGRRPKPDPVSSEGKEKEEPSGPTG